MNNRKYFIKLFYITICFLIFFFGLLFENKKFYPYLELKTIYKKIINLKKDSIKIKNKETLISKKFNNFELIKLNPTLDTIETSLVRLDKKEFDLNNIFIKSQKIKSRGGICSFDQKLVIISSSGEGGIFNQSLEQLLFFDLSKHFQKIDLNINIVQDVYCLKTDSNKIEFLINIQKKELKPFKEMNYVGEYTSNIYKITLSKNNIFSKLIYKSKKHGVNWAGRILLNENNLYISFSSREANEEGKYKIPLSQNDKYLEGKIIKINLNNDIASIFSKGHRNPQGLIITKEGKIISTEHGPKGGDEINIISKNKNYGWPLVTYGTTYESFKAYDYINTIPGRHNGFEKPFFSWTPGIGISNLLEVDKFDKKWDGDLIIASLKNMSLYRLRIDKEKERVLFAERIWIGNRIRDVAFNNKNIFLWTDDQKIITLAKSENTLVSRINKSYDIVTIGVCLSCHYLQTGDKPLKPIAPTLSKIFERDIASDEYNYSNALKDLDGKWDEVKMAKYLLNPQKFAPGTYKAYKNNSQIEVFKIIREIKKLSSSGD